MRPPARPHYLRRNDTVWTPPAVIYLDTESRTLPEVGQDVLALRLWCAKFHDRRPARLSVPDVVKGHGTSAAELVDWITQRMRGRKTVWLFAHNLSFDLATTRLPLALAAAGWRVSDAAIGGKAPWIRMGKGDKVLTMVDSGSWFPVKLEDVGAQLGMIKPELPAELDDEPTWLLRCWADVEILSAAMDQVLRWWDSEGLGHFNITGPACGWNAFRHIFTVQRIVMNPDPGAVAADRLAVHGGRRGVWRIGRVAGGPLLELDLTGAYPTVAAELPLPVRRASAFDSLPLDDRRISSDRWGILAEVELETDVPRWPVRWRGATWYPVGRFKAHLAGPEIAEAARLGCLRAIGPGHAHQLSTVLMAWARWVLSVQSDAETPDRGAVRILAKHWGRSVIGRFASRGFDKVKMGASPVPGWGYEEGWDRASGTRGGYVDLAGERWWVSSSAVSDNAYPAVLAWVESHVRLRLSRVLELLGNTTVIQCDTDGLIVTKDGLIKWAEHRGYQSLHSDNGEGAIEFALSALNRLVYPLHIRVKKTHAQAHILGPQHIEVPGERRFSGLPRDAKAGRDGKYSAKTWPKLQWQLTHGDARGYVRPVVTPTVKGPFANAWVLSTGRTEPVRAVISSSGATEILPWEFMPARIRAKKLGPDQHRLLQALMPDSLQ